MSIEGQENNNPFGMKISDPELIRKITEGGLESLSPDDINSIGIEVKAGWTKCKKGFPCGIHRDIVSVP